MKNRLVVLPAIQRPIQEAPGFEKKLLATHKLDLMGLCGFGCLYCSSNSGNYLRIRREAFADETERQLGERVYPKEDPSLTFMWGDVLEKLEAQLTTKEKRWGTGKTLVLSMLTDAFSPLLVANGVTRRALDMVLERTSFRIRVLTKSAIVGQPIWTRYFAKHADRFVVGLSIGTLDGAWSRAVEVGTSSPRARVSALRSLRAAGVPTYGMLCPVFPDAVDRLDELLEAVDPSACEHVWAEPYNDRENWRAVQAGYAKDTTTWQWFQKAYGEGDAAEWSDYAAGLYLKLRDRAVRDGWLSKLRYLLYEDGIVAQDAWAFRYLRGVLLQNKPGGDGRSESPWFAALQREVEASG